METSGTMNRSDITGSDLDEWVDKVFDPIMQDDAVQSLTSTGVLHRSLKGSGDNQVCLIRTACPYVMSNMHNS